MYCPNCGARVQDVDAYCADCGRALTRQPQATPAHAIETQTEDTTPTADEDAETKYVGYAGVVLRSGADASAAVVRELSKGTPVRVLEAAPAKLMVRVVTDDGHEGWVNMVELTASPGVPGAAPSQGTSPADRRASGQTATSGPSWSGQATVTRPVGKTVQTPSGEYELAGFGIRLGGLLIDGVIYLVVSLVLLGVTASATATDGSGASGLLILLSYGGPFAAQWTFNAIGWSPGKRAVGLRITGDDGQPPGAGKGLGRTLGAILSSIPFFLGYLWAAWDGKNQTWHDKMASTYVVRLR